MGSSLCKKQGGIMELIQLLKYVLMTDTINSAGENHLWFLLELIILCAEPLHQLWTVLKRREWMEKAFAVVIFGMPVFMLVLIQTTVMEGFFSHKYLLCYRETREILGQSVLYQEVIWVNLITIVLILLCFIITVRFNKDRRKHKFSAFLSIGGLEFVTGILMTGFSWYILKENPEFLFEQNPKAALVYIYMGWHMVLKTVMLLGIILFSVLFYRKEQRIYGIEMDAGDYLEELIRQQGRFMSIVSGLYLLVLCLLDVMVLKETWNGMPLGSKLADIIGYSVIMFSMNLFLLAMTVVVAVVFYINVKRWINPESDRVFAAMESWGNKGYIMQTLCNERYKSEKRIFKSRRYEVTENFIYRPCLFWKYDLFYLKQLKSVTQVAGMEGICTILTFRDGKKFKAYHMKKSTIAHIKQFLPQEESKWN